MVESATLVDEEIAALNVALERDFDPHRRVAVLAAEAEGYLPAEILASNGRAAPGEPGYAPHSPPAKLRTDTGEEVTVEVRPAAPALLVLTDAQYPGWSAQVDGEERPILGANYFYRAVLVRPGDREVVFTYRSAPFERGRQISAATLLLAIPALGLVHLARRRASRPAAA